MIIASADYIKCDMVMTVDEKTFLPLSIEADYFCCVCIEERFQVSDKYIFAYNG